MNSVKQRHAMRHSEKRTASDVAPGLCPPLRRRTLALSRRGRFRPSGSGGAGGRIHLASYAAIASRRQAATASGKKEELT